MNLIYSNPSVYYVYAYLRNKDTQNGKCGSPYYIGKGKDLRAYKPHRNKNSGVYTPKDKRFIVFLETNLTEMGAYALERRYVTWYGTQYDNTGILRNLTKGGPGIFGRTFKHTEETIIKIRNSNIGKKRKPFSKEVLFKMHSMAIGIPKSEETKAKMRKPKSDAHSKNISKGRTGIQFTDAHKEAISRGASKYWYTLTSPVGEVYEMHSINRFCKDRNICEQKFKNYSNMGKIPEAQNNSTQKRINASGWDVKRISTV
jgi:hypothetical protein